MLGSPSHVATELIRPGQVSRLSQCPDFLLSPPICSFPLPPNKASERVQRGESEFHQHSPALTTLTALNTPCHFLSRSPLPSACTLPCASTQLDWLASRRRRRPSGCRQRDLIAPLHHINLRAFCLDLTSTSPRPHLDPPDLTRPHNCEA